MTKSKRVRGRKKVGRSRKYRGGLNTQGDTGSSQTPLAGSTTEIGRRDNVVPTQLVGSTNTTGRRANGANGANGDPLTKLEYGDIGELRGILGTIRVDFFRNIRDYITKNNTPPSDGSPEVQAQYRISREKRALAMMYLTRVYISTEGNPEFDTTPFDEDYTTCRAKLDKGFRIKEIDRIQPLIRAALDDTHISADKHANAENISAVMKYIENVFTILKEAQSLP